MGDSVWYHIYPENDLVEHDTSGNGEGCCICNPTIDYENFLIIHDSLDRRECFEKRAL